MCAAPSSTRNNEEAKDEQVSRCGQAGGDACAPGRARLGEGAGCAMASEGEKRRQVGGGGGEIKASGLVVRGEATTLVDRCSHPSRFAPEVDSQLSLARLLPLSFLPFSSPPSRPRFRPAPRYQ